MSPVSVARLTARQEHTLSRILRFPPLSARPLSNSANYFPRFPGRRPPHTSPVGGGCVKSSISFGSFCGGKVHFFYKKHPPFHFLTKNTPHFISCLRACTADSAVDYRAAPSVDYHLLPFFFLAPRASLPG